LGCLHRTGIAESCKGLEQIMGSHQQHLEEAPPNIQGLCQTLIIQAWRPANDSDQVMAQSG
jgi:hypothetical protein